VEGTMINKQMINWEKNNSFYPVTEDEILRTEEKLGINFPKELKAFYLEIGYGFIEGSEYNINRVMDPFSVRDFRLRTGAFEFYPEIDLYDHFEDGKLIFFESDESALLSIELGGSEKNKIFYYNMPIADSLEEFITKVQENDNYFVDMLE
jgi:hypothetical protein